MTNTGGASASRTVELTVGGEVRDAQEVTLESGDAQRVPLTWETGDGDAGEHTASVSSRTDFAEVLVRVEAASTPTATLTPTPATTDEPTRPGQTAETGFVGIVEWAVEPTEIRPGDSVTATATLQNDRSSRWTVTVEVLRDGAVIGSEDVTLSGGATRSVSFTHTFESAGTYRLGIAGEESERIDVTVATEATTPTATAPPSDPGHDEPTATVPQSPASDDQPGFGVVIATIALLVVALLARRRRNAV